MTMTDWIAIQAKQIRKQQYKKLAKEIKREAKYRSENWGTPYCRHLEEIAKELGTTWQTITKGGR